MSKYIDTEKLKSEIERLQRAAAITMEELQMDEPSERMRGELDAYDDILYFIDSLQQKQPNNMIQWTGNNLKEVIDFTGKSPRFGEWFKSWEEYENYVYTHNNLLKLFCEDGSHYEVPVSAWIVKTPDGYNVPSTARFIPAKQEQPEYGYLSTTYIHGKKARWNVGDTLAYYLCTSDEEGEIIIGEITKVEFSNEEGWVYTFEDESVWDEQSLVEEGVYKIIENEK